MQLSLLKLELDLSKRKTKKEKGTKMNGGKIGPNRPQNRTRVEVMMRERSCLAGMLSFEGFEQVRGHACCLRNKG